MAIGINLPNQNPGVGMDPNMIPTLPRRWGESEQAYRIRLQEFQAPYHQAASSRNAIETEANRQGTQIDEATYKKSNIARTRLDELRQLLAAEEGRKFNMAIPDIAESAQAQGFLETSGFGNALARERTRLAGDTAFRLSDQALKDRDIELGGIDKAVNARTGLQTGGLERQFSENDLTRSERLARELAVYGVPAPAKGESSTDKLIRQGSGIVGIGTGLAQIGAGGGTYLCTKMKSLGIMTAKEVKMVHNKVFPVMRTHALDYLMYNLFAPTFILLNPNYDWTSLKTQLCDRVLSASSSEEAYQIYKQTCMELFSGSLIPVEA